MLGRGSAHCGFLRSPFINGGGQAEKDTLQNRSEREVLLLDAWTVDAPHGRTCISALEDRNTSDACYLERPLRGLRRRRRRQRTSRISCEHSARLQTLRERHLCRLRSGYARA